MAFYFKQGNQFRVTKESNLDIYKRLPVGNYVVCYNDIEGAFYLEMVDSFVSPSKIYGDTLNNVERILKTYHNRDNSTGVLLCGEKGSGKTLLSKMVCITAAASDIPTIIVNHHWCGDAFNQFIQNIDQECIVLFDEFEKTYNESRQEQLLTLLDGVFPTRKLFIFTCNNKYKIDSNMNNRPGRIYYSLEFRGLGINFIKEYCLENLNNHDFIEEICSLSMLFAAFNFDMLKGLVEEINRYGESPMECIKYLNIKPSVSEAVNRKFNVELFVDDILVDKSKCTKQWYGDPVSDEIRVCIVHDSDHKTAQSIFPAYEDDEDDEDVVQPINGKGTNYYFNYSNLHEIKPDTGQMIYKKDNLILILTQIIETGEDFYKKANNFRSMAKIYRK